MFLANLIHLIHHDNDVHDFASVVLFDVTVHPQELRSARYRTAAFDGLGIDRYIVRHQ